MWQQFYFASASICITIITIVVIIKAANDRAIRGPRRYSRRLDRLERDVEELQGSSVGSENMYNRLQEACNDIEIIKRKTDFLSADPNKADFGQVLDIEKIHKEVVELKMKKLNADTFYKERDHLSKSVQQLMGTNTILHKRHYEVDQAYKAEMNKIIEQLVSVDEGAARKIEKAYELIKNDSHTIATKFEHINHWKNDVINQVSSFSKELAQLASNDANYSRRILLLEEKVSD